MLAGGTVAISYQYDIAQAQSFYHRKWQSCIQSFFLNTKLSYIQHWLNN